jgi:hypothetical protein
MKANAHAFMGVFVWDALLNAQDAVSCVYTARQAVFLPLPGHSAFSGPATPGERLSAHQLPCKILSTESIDNA